MSILQKGSVQVVRKNSEGYSEDRRKKKTNIITPKMLSVTWKELVENNFKIIYQNCVL